MKARVITVDVSEYSATTGTGSWILIQLSRLMVQGIAVPLESSSLALAEWFIVRHSRQKRSIISRIAPYCSRDIVRCQAKLYLAIWLRDSNRSSCLPFFCAPKLPQAMTLDCKTPRLSLAWQCTRSASVTSTLRKTRVQNVPTLDFWRPKTIVSPDEIETVRLYGSHSNVAGFK